MKKIIFTLLLFAFCLYAESQNLIPNPSFEIYDTCPYNPSQINFAPPWFSANTGTPDYFNSCNSSFFNVPNNFLGYQTAKSGLGYCGLTFYNNTTAANLREYIEIQLSDTLITGVTYCVSFYVSLANVSRYATSNISAYFSNSILTNATQNYINVIPQIQNDTNNIVTDTVNWFLVWDTYVAVGGEKYFTIGNFETNINSKIDSIVGNFQPDAYYYVDDISVIDCDSLVGIPELPKKSSFLVYPNPNMGTMEVSYSLNVNETGSFEIYEISVKKVTTFSLNNNETKLKIENSQLSAGVYYYNIRINNQIIQTEKLILVK